LNEQSKPANPSELLTHPDVVHAIHREARHLVRMRLFRRVDRADVIADLRLEVAIRLQAFDPRRSGLNGFASTAARHGAISMLRARAAKARGGDRVPVSIECIVADRGSSDEIVSEALGRATGRVGVDAAERIATSEDVRFLLGALPPDLAEVAAALCTSAPSAACNRLGRSRRQVRLAIGRIRRFCEMRDLRP
jgi:DNA-directed RNA polymerase specialized sigma24 family protein